jgi:DNA-directed RNA polymerase specialized sigma24 family protein
VLARLAAEAEGPEPGLQMDELWDEEWRDNIYRSALARVRGRVNPKQFQVFDGCVLQNQRPADVARMLGISTAQVYLARHRVTAAVKRAVKDLEAELGGPGL